METISAGTYVGNVIDYGINETKKGNPQIFIKFHLPQIEKKLTWFGSLASEKAIEITCKALINCGFSKTDLALLTNGVESGELDTDKELILVVENEEYEGKTRTKIQWINLPNAGVQNKLDQAGAVQKLSGLNVAGIMMQLQQEAGVKSNVTYESNQQKSEQSDRSSDNAPF